MLVPHGGVILILVLGVLSSVTALDGFALPAPMRVALAMCAPALAVLGELLAYEARSARLRDAGLSLESLAAVAHLAMHLVALRAVGAERSWELLVALSAANIVVMGLALRFALRSLARGAIASVVDELREQPESFSGRVERELSLFGGTALTFALCSAGFVFVLAQSALRKPELWPKFASAAALFTACALIAIKSGLARRASLLETIARTRA